MGKRASAHHDCSCPASVAGDAGSHNCYTTKSNLLYDEVEPPEPTVCCIRDPHHQTAIEQPIPTVQRIVRKIQLSGHDAPARFLNLDMIMTGPTRIVGGHDGRKPPAPTEVCILVAPQPEAGIVIDTGLIGMPKLNQRLWNGLAAGVQDETCEGDPFGASTARSRFNGASGLKYGPSVCAMVGSSPLPHSGVSSSTDRACAPAG